MTLFNHIDQPGLSWRTKLAEEDFILIQSGDGVWIRNSIPFGIKNSSLTALALIKSIVLKEQKPFCLAASLPLPGIFDPPIKKIFLSVLGPSAVKIYFGQACFFIEFRQELCLKETCY